MGTSPSPASHPLARLAAVVLFLLLLAGAAWLGADLWARQPAKPPPKEEEEEPAKTAPKRAPKDEEEESAKPKRKVIRVDDDPPPKGGDPSLSEGIDLVTAAR